MSIACDIQMATCDLSFEVSSDLSSWIFIRTEVKPDFSLPMPTLCEKEHSENQNSKNLHHKLLSLIPSYPSQRPHFPFISVCKEITKKKFFFPFLFPFFQFSPTFLQPHTLFSTPSLMSLLTMVCKGPVEVTTSVALGCDRDSVGMD